MVPGGGDPKFRFKDKQGRVKRQAARFRIYGLNKRGVPVREITLDQSGVSIEWTVHVANKKPAWYEYNNAMDLLLSARKVSAEELKHLAALIREARKKEK